MFVLRGGRRKDRDDSEIRVRWSVGSGRSALGAELEASVDEGDG